MGLFLPFIFSKICEKKYKQKKNNNEKQEKT